MLNRKDKKERKKLLKEAREINKYRRDTFFYKPFFDAHYEAIMQRVKELDIKSLRDDLSKDNPYYKSSR